MIAGLWLRVRAALLRRRLEREMQEEMAEHLARSTERLTARGMSPVAARRAAEREFGNVAWLQEQARDARGTAWLDALAGDARYAVRQYARRPATTFAMFVVLVFGISITTLLFSFVHSYATQAPPGVVRSDDLVRIRGSQSAGVHGRGMRAFPEDELTAYTRLTQHFADVVGWTAGTALLDAGPEPEQRGLEARVTFVTDGYFRVLGVRPLLGPGLGTMASGDPSLATTAVVSHATWSTLFGRDGGVIGSTISLNGVPVTIVGVAPERFLGVGGAGDFRMWMPDAARRLLLADGPAHYSAVARLQPGVTTRQATAATQVIAAAHATAEPPQAGRSAPEEPATDVVPLRSTNGDPMYERDVKLLSALIGVLALLILLVTCTNVSALLTGVATARRHEIAIRISLGAARARLIRQLLTESALLSCAAAAAAMGIVVAMLHAVRVLNSELPLEPRLTLPATAFTFGVALAVGVLFGLSPALHATRLAVSGVLRDASANLVATRARLQRVLVVAQIAFTQPLTVLLAAVLLTVLGEFQPAPRSDFADRIVVLSARSTEPAGASARAAAALLEQLRGTTQRVIERVVSTPGVIAAAPHWGGEQRIGSYTTGHDGASADAVANTVALAAHHASPDFFDIMGIDVLRGRSFAPGDMTAEGAASPRAVVIDVALARELWPGADPIGRELRPATDTSRSGSLVVIGVVDHAASRRSVAGIDHFVFVPADTTRIPTGLLVRTATPAATMLATLRAVAQQEAPSLVVDARTLADIADDHEHNFRLAASGVSAAGLAALLLAGLGLYAVVTFAVGQRTREIAVRMAIGGDRRHVVRRFVADGLRLSAIGIVFGLPVSLLALRALLATPGVPQVPLPSVTGIAALSVILVATVAAWVPARRAASVDPAITLRSE